MCTEYKIINKYDHVEIYKNGQFICNADDFVEAGKKIDKIEEGEKA